MPRTRRTALVPVVAAGVVLTGALVMAAIIELTTEDLRLRGTQIGEVPSNAIRTSTNCAACHAGFDPLNEPGATWQGSLMGQAGRDPLFFAQMALANQDTVTAGQFCMRCHVPMSFVTGHAGQPNGSTLSSTDKDGVTCHLCHTMTDPVYRAGVSPAEDAPILAGMSYGPPQQYGNSMFVLDPTGTRRGPRQTTEAPHPTIYSPFHSTGGFCGTCHEVGNVAVSRQADGTYRYNALNQPAPSEDPEQLFPLERTYSEWKHSAFANGGVDMGGRFGGIGASVVSTCQDCHMPRAAGSAAAQASPRPDLRRHDFAGASAQVLDIIAAYTRNDPAVSQANLAAGRARAVDMLQRAATLELSQTGATLNVRVVNQGGHKLPTGHIEGRRVWINIRFLDGAGALLEERGGYDLTTADLDKATTRVYEMRVGISASAAGATGLPTGVTTHMALADTIEWDNRIPPRGYSNAVYEAAGAPAVGQPYADGQYWDDAPFAVPAGSARAEVRLYYQNTPREYIEHLRDANTSNSWGNTLYTLWSSTGKGAPLEMATGTLLLTPVCTADFNGDGLLNPDDLADYITCYFDLPPCAAGDFNADGLVNPDDLADYITAFFDGCA